nr:unnamed protein product [Amyelois transitella]
MYTKSGINDMCKVCLSTGRTLTPLGKYLYLFTKICRKLKPVYKSANLLICWECHNLLQKVEKFQQKVLTAQNILKNLENSLDGNTQYNFRLSTLQSVLNQDTNFYFCEKSTESPVTATVENIAFDAIKEETYALKCEQNNECEIELKLNNEIKDEKVDLEQEILNNLFDANITNIDNIKDEIEESDHHYDDLLNLDDFNEENKKKEVKRREKRRRKDFRRPYKVIYKNGDNIYGLYDTVPVESSELNLLREKQRLSKDYVKMTYKCELCIVGYPNKNTYLQHLRSHDKFNKKYECDTCHQRFDAKNYLVKHCSTHLYKYVCKICNEEFLRKQYVQRHVRHEHDRAYECRYCGRHFQCKVEILSHFKTHIEFVCDICGKVALKKSVLERHMRVRHLPHICKICNITFKTKRSHRSHIQKKHIKSRTEDAFCVECNVQFDNVPTYKMHLNTSVKHKPKSNVKYPCPECHKLFNKKMNMKYHYNYAHTGRTKFYCEACAKYFLNNYQLRRHKAAFHDKIKPLKNKFCPHCGRGFSERRILNNHIRTHTGERPFVCAVCGAAFTQAYPLTTHMRSVHKIGTKPVRSVK